MVFRRIAETRVLKQLTDGDRTTSDGKLFHNVTVAGKKLNRYASTHTTYIHTNLYSAKNRGNKSEALAQDD